MEKLMKALVLEDTSPLLVAREIPIPVPGPGEVLIRVEASPINPSDLSYIKGLYFSSPTLPSVPGFEGSGTVIGSGGGLLSWSLQGKRVAFLVLATGAWAEYAVTSAQFCMPVADHISFGQAACFFVNPLTCLGMMETILKGKHLGVVHTAAASSLGKMLLRMCQEHRIPLVNIVRRQEQVETLKSLGAQFVLNSEEQGFDEELGNLCKELNASVAFDAVAGELTGKVMRALVKGGTVYVYGALSGLGAGGVNPAQFIFEGKTLTGFYLASYMRSKGMLRQWSTTRQARKMLQDQLRTHIAREFPIEAGGEAINFYASHMSQGKVLIRPS